jgi:hypothetical protein
MACLGAPGRRGILSFMGRPGRVVTWMVGAVAATAACGAAGAAADVELEASMTPARVEFPATREIVTRLAIRNRDQGAARLSLVVAPHWSYSRATDGSPRIREGKLAGEPSRAPSW